jgi:branched-chain amino acid transport system ATP-binding protein
VTTMTDQAPSAGAAAAAPALDVEGLTTGYGRTTILRGLSLTVPVGEATALLGPNGAGKSTLLRAVSGFLPAIRGTIRMFGDDITHTASHRRFLSGLCLVPEGRGIFRSLTVRDNIAMQARRGEEKEAIGQATSAFPVLGTRLGQTAGTMSGGEQQMLAMASAYVRNPRLVLVDEASLGLAPIVVDEIFAFLESLTAKGSSLLVVDQFATRALAMATTAYVMRRGELVFAGSADELRNSDLFRAYVGT